MIQGLFSLFLLKTLLKGKSLNIIKPKSGGNENKTLDPAPFFH